jgi:amino acid permease
MELIFEAVLEFVCELFFECLGGLINSKKVPKHIRILILSVILVPLILLMLIVVFKKMSTSIALSIICFIIMLLLLLAYIVILSKILKGTSLKHNKKERT